MTNEQVLQRFAFDFVCQSTDPGNAGYLQLSFEAAHAAAEGTVLEGFTVDEIREMFWAEHARANKAFRRARGRS